MLISKLIRSEAIHWSLMRRMTFSALSTELSFSNPSLKIAATPPQKCWKSYASWSPVLRMTRHVSIDVAPFCRRGGNTKMPQWLPQRCSPCQSRPLRRGGFLGEGQGETFLGERSEMSAWRRVVIIAMYFLTEPEVYPKKNHGHSTITWCCMLSWCFHGFLRWVSLIMNRRTSAYITWTSLMVRIKI